ncbi:MAG: hypothetical protein IKN55_13205 [Oscillospiraceae bacterium]|nr:hypothetical protein [Oscillospiraceae bacterium]
MSFTIPGASMPNPGTQPIDLNKLKTDIQEWGKNNNDGTNNEPTYKSCNRSSAYFFFLKRKMEEFHPEIPAFLQNPEDPKYSNHRKIMIVLANILLRDYCNFDIVARQINYREVCRYDGKHNDLVNLVEGWAKEIDSENWENLTEVCIRIDSELYPIALYSTQKFIVFPFNTINPIIQDMLIGCENGRYSLDALERELKERPMSDRALYAALTDSSASLNADPVLDAFAQWMKRRFKDITKPGGSAYPMEFRCIPVKDTAKSLTKLPIPKLPDVPIDHLFSEQLLIISSNANVTNGEFGFSAVANNNIGELDPGAPQHAVIAPLSAELIQKLYNPGGSNTLLYKGCSVLRENGKYHVQIELEINGASCIFKKIYESGDVKKCNNFPLISILTSGLSATTPVRLYRTDYKKPVPASPVYLDGQYIKLGKSGDTYELPFDTTMAVNAGQFYYSSVSYHDAKAGRSFYCGYLVFEQNGPQSLYAKAAASTHTAVIIDEANDIAQIAVFDTANMRDVTSYNVYNDRILFFNTNKRDDLDQSIKNRCWGDLSTTIFDLGDGRYALAPFSKEFAAMVAKAEVTIAHATLQINGDDWIFSVSFNFSGKLQQAAPRVYSRNEQFTMANPPFFFAVNTIDKISNALGYEIIKVANMGMTTRTSALVTNGVDSNDLEFRIENKVLTSSMFVTPNGPDVFVHVYNGNDYMGQITLNLADYTQADGFQALKDGHMSCAAIMLVRNMGPTKPKEIITGTVFDDNLFLIVKETNRAIYNEYQAWRKNDLVVDIAGMTVDQMEGKEYQAVFPFSLRMLQNINDGSLTILPGSTKVVFNATERCYEVEVKIRIPGTDTFVPFSMKYELSQSKVVKCDNLPFVIAVVNSDNQHKGLARFNNEISRVLRDHIDGSSLNIEIVEGEYKKLEDGGRIVPIEGDQVVLRLSILNQGAQASCHILYQANDPFTDSVFSLKSEETGTQIVVDYDQKKTAVTKLDVFTDYVIYTVPMLRDNENPVFAGNTQCVEAYPIGEGDMRESRIYSIPVTMSFTALMERRGLQIATYTNVKFQNKRKDGTLSQAVIDDLSDLYVTISLQGLNTHGGPASITKVYPPDHVIDFVNYELPTLTVFPYVNFVADGSFGPQMNGKPLWQHYNFAKFTKLLETPQKATEPRDRDALGSRVNFWVNGEKIVFHERKSKLKQSNPDEQKEMKVGTVNGWGRYIHMTYDGSADEAPPQEIDSRLDGKEFGCIIMEPASQVTVSAGMTATVGVDFGTRNSIIAMQAGGAMGTAYPYHGNKDLQQIIIPNMMREEFEELSNYCYIPHFSGSPAVGGPGCGKFASSVMVYANVLDPRALVEPYDLGFVPNVQGDVLRRIMDGMNEAGNMGDVLGFYTDLKISTDGTGPKVELMKRNVRTFIKSIMFHTVLNCYQAGCGDITIRFSAPSDSYAASLGTVWNEALGYINRFIPQAAHGYIHVGNYATEAAALFEDLKTYMPGGFGGMPKYSAITDGGDGTYDFTINKYENGVLSTPPGGAFSLRYAGQQIMTDSVNAFYDHLVARNDGYHNENVRKKFRSMWKAKSEDKEDQDTLIEMVANLSKHRERGGLDREMEKTLALMLIEQFGIDYDKLMIPNPKSMDDYVNPEYVNFVRMIQYKFLFLFNILGEQIRKTVRLEQENQTSFNVYLYGGTAQALLIAEPLCRGDLSTFKHHADKLPMAMFIDAMLDLPKNMYGVKYGVNFLPANDLEKREIARGLIAMPAANMTMAGAAGGVQIPNFNAGADNGAADDGFQFPGGFAGLNGFGGFGAAQQAEPAVQMDAQRPQTIEQFIDNLKEILNKRTVKLPQGEVCIDFFLKFLDEQQKPVQLSQILDDSYVKSQLSKELTVMWECVMLENPDIDDPMLLYHIYTLKMVGIAIEIWLRRK